MITIKPKDGNLLVWKDQKIISDSIFAPDNFDVSKVEEMIKDEALKLKEEWENELQQELLSDGDSMPVV